MLEAVRAAELSEGPPPVMVGVATRTSPFDHDEGTVILRRLEQAGLVRGSHDRGTGSTPPAPYEVELTAEGRRAVGQWPTAEATLDLLVAALRSAASAASSEHDRSKLAKAADTMQDVTKSTAVALVVAALKAALGLP